MRKYFLLPLLFVCLSFCLSKEEEKQKPAWDHGNPWDRAPGAPPRIVTDGCHVGCDCSQQCNVCQQGNVTVLCLQGTHYEMGVNYGKVLQPQLLHIKQMLWNYYLEGQGGKKPKYNYQYLANLANLWHYRYSYNYQSFVSGMSKGTGLSLQDAKIINSMVLLGVLDDWNGCPGGPPGSNNAFGLMGGCAYAFIPPSRSKTRMGLVARNYDFPMPWYDISQYLVTTILIENDKVPTAIISMPGQMYCQNCINKNGLFLELNNGGPSGGFCVNSYRRGLLINMLLYMQNSGSFYELDYQFRTTKGDIALIVSAADAYQSKIYEFTPYLGSRTFELPSSMALSATNFFQNNTWKGTYPASDPTCWDGITRKRNIDMNIARTPIHDVNSIKNFWVKTIPQAGAVWADTCYQLIHDFSTGNFHIRSVKHGGVWQEIGLQAIFDSIPDPPK